MAGYHNYSMSNNAVDAYKFGEKPLSKWNKTDILSEIENQEDCEFGFSLDLLKKLTAPQLKKHFLIQSSWHHTSSHYNRTDFYSVDFDRLETITDSDLEKIISEKEAKKEETVKTAKCKFLTWEGSRKRPKAVEHIEVCEIKGNWAFTSYGKKSITGTGFEILEDK